MESSSLPKPLPSLFPSSSYSFARFRLYWGCQDGGCPHELSTKLLPFSSIHGGPDKSPTLSTVRFPCSLMADRQFSVASLEKTALETILVSIRLWVVALGATRHCYAYHSRGGSLVSLSFSLGSSFPSSQVCRIVYWSLYEP